MWGDDSEQLKQAFCAILLRVKHHHPPCRRRFRVRFSMIFWFLWGIQNPILVKKRARFCFKRWWSVLDTHRITHNIYCSLIPIGGFIFWIFDVF